MEGNTQSLPCDVIYTILSKLPVKSLYQLRCVCKSWRDVISEPQFAKSHLTESIKLVDRQRIFVRDTRDACFRSIGCDSIGTCDGFDEKLCFTVEKYTRAKVLCSCNGLVLLRVNKTDNMCVLWNPSIRDSKSSHVHLIYLATTVHMDFTTILPWMITSEMVLANGVLHLVALKPRKVAKVRPPPQPYQPYQFFYDDSDSEDGNTHLYKIVCFDTVDEKLKEMPQPNCINEGDKFSLTLMRGCLSLYCDIAAGRGPRVVVWTMKQYGDNNSWTKFIVIPRHLGICYFCTLTPLCATKKGEVVVMTDRRQAPANLAIKSKLSNFICGYVL